MICPECGRAQVEKYENGTSQGYKCPSCGYGLIASTFNPMDDDQTVYTISLPSQTLEHSLSLRTVAKVGHRSYVQAKCALENGEPVLCRGKAREIEKAAKMLAEQRIVFEIDPHFPY